MVDIFLKKLCKKKISPDSGSALSYFWKWISHSTIYIRNLCWVTKI